MCRSTTNNYNTFIILFESYINILLSGACIMFQCPFLKGICMYPFMFYVTLTKYILVIFCQNIKQKYVVECEWNGWFLIYWNASCVIY